jgi:penicillin-binding protein 2
VANDVTGTAYRQSQLNLGPIMMAGKTGTAQVRSYDSGNRKGVGLPWKLRDHNLFVAFAPFDEPRYAVAIIVQHGGGGGATEGAPRAREIMRIALLKDPEVRARIEQPLPSDRAPQPPAAEDPSLGAPDDIAPPDFAPSPPPEMGAPGAPSPSVSPRGPA